MADAHGFDMVNGLTNKVIAYLFICWPEEDKKACEFSPFAVRVTNAKKLLLAIYLNANKWGDKIRKIIVQHCIVDNMD